MRLRRRDALRHQLRFGEDELILLPGDQWLPEVRHVPEAAGERRDLVWIRAVCRRVVAAVPAERVESEVVVEPRIVSREHDVDERLPGDDVLPERGLRELVPDV